MKIKIFKTRFRFIKFSFFVFLLLTLVINDCRKTTDDDILAVVGNIIIQKADYIKRYNKIRKRIGLPDNGAVRRKVLDNIINEELLLIEARRRGYEEDFTDLKEMERIKIQELLNQFNQEIIVKKVQVSENEIRKLFIDLNTRIKARHLYAPTFEKADSLSRLLKQGAVFERLARDIFKDPLLKESGGSLGYFKVDEMEPVFEAAAYEMKAGEISDPVRTRHGYSIIKIEDIKTNPLLTEIEFRKHLEKMRAYLYRRKVRKVMQDYVDSIRTVLDISFNEEILKDIYRDLETNQLKHESIESKDKIQERADTQSSELVYSKLGIWDVTKFQEMAQFTSEKQIRWIRSERDLKDFIAGLVVRRFIISKARELKLDKTDKYRTRICEEWKTLLLDRIQKDLFNEIVISDDSLQIYYKKYSERYSVPPKIGLRQIIVRDKESADRISLLLRQGISFAQLIDTLTIEMKNDERNGDLGYFTPKELGKWANALFSLSPGEWTGPIKIDSLYVFWQCIDKRKAQIREFDEVRSNVEKTLKSVLWDDVRQNKLNEIRKTVACESFPERLRTARL